ncbi:Voltage-dependent T-type calcium channel subunit alpha-1H [Aphelenchoides bicaudatus]|nr:Voltage-dependent T-type calcium channel subunit alpha-1H [Aphelenchoides bicaudatus]
MFQRPVAKDMRSFQSLSKFTGLPQKRSVMNRRQSLAQSRRYSNSRRRTRNDSQNEEEMSSGQLQTDYALDSVSVETGQRSSTKRVCVASEFDVEPSPKSSQARPSQIEWQENLEDVYVDEELDLPYPGFVEPSLGCLKQAQPPRSWALMMVMNPYFDRLTMIVILINCVTLGMYRPCEDGADCNTYRCLVLAMVDHMIFFYFAAEMIIKIVALGFCGENAYLSETWNRLDFFIVVAGCAEYLLQEYLGNINLTAIRTIRVLRPLRAVNRIPSMRILVNLLLDTLPMLGNVLLLCFFVFFIFGIVGVQLWAGLLRNRCVINLPRTNFTSEIAEIVFNNTTLTRYYIPEDTSLDYICSQADASGLHTCSNLPAYFDGKTRCNLTLDEYDKVSNDSCINWNFYYNECRVMHKNPFQGSVSFDNIGFAWVAIFLVISLEGWTDLMYLIQDAHSFYAWVYFVLLIVVGSFFMINLCLVVIATQFAETKRRETERMLQERKRMRSCGSLTSSEQGMVTSSKEGGGGDSVYAAIVRLITHGCRRLHRYLSRRWAEYKQQKEERRKTALGQEAQTELLANSTENADIKMQNMHENESPVENHSDRRQSTGFKSNGSTKRIRLVQHGTTGNNLERWDEVNRRDEPNAEIIDGEETMSRSRRSTHQFHGSSMSFEEPMPIIKRKTILTKFREAVKRFSESNHFTRGILVAILINTICKFLNDCNTGQDNWAPEF